MVTYWLSYFSIKIVEMFGIHGISVIPTCQFSVDRYSSNLQNKQEKNKSYYLKKKVFAISIKLQPFFGYLIYQKLTEAVHCISICFEYQRQANITCKTDLKLQQRRFPSQCKDSWRLFISLQSKDRKKRMYTLSKVKNLRELLLQRQEVP